MVSGALSPGKVTIGNGLTATDYHCVSGSNVNSIAMGTNTNDKPAAYWTFEDATTATIPLNAVDGKSYGTMYLPFDVQLSQTVDVVNQTFSGTFAYIVEVTGTRAALNMKQISKIQANTPVLLINTEAATSTDVTITSDATALSGTNNLAGTYFNKTSLETNEYVFGTSNDELGFWKMKEGKKVGANKAYLVYNGTPSSVKGFSLDFSEVTSISEIAGSTQKAQVFDLSGRRVKEPVRGLYIMNGKKVLVK